MEPRDETATGLMEPVHASTPRRVGPPDGSMGRRKVRVLHVITDLHYGGAETLLLETLRALDTERFESTLCLTLRGGALCDRVRELGIPLVELGTRDVLFDVRGIWRLHKVIREVQPDIVHAHLLTADLLARLACATSRKRVRMISTFHNHYYWQRGGSWKRRLKARWFSFTAHRLCDAWIAVSDRIREIYQVELGYRKPTFFALRNFVDVDQFEPPTPAERARARLSLDVHDADRRIFLNVGSLCEQKAQDRLIRAFAVLARECPHAMLWIAGEGPRRRELEALVRERRLDARVLLLGARSDVKNLLHAADVFVSSSDWEGMPISMLEAMSTERPVLATAVGGVPELIEDGITGRLVPPGNEEALACALQEFARERPSDATWGRAARERVRRRHSAGSVVRELERIYEGVLTET